jgi:hypothetical protein
MKSRKNREGTPDPLIKSQVQSGPEPNIDKERPTIPNPLAFSSTMEGVCCARVQAQKTSIAEEVTMI